MVTEGSLVDDVFHFCSLLHSTLVSAELRVVFNKKNKKYFEKKINNKTVKN